MSSFEAIAHQPKNIRISGGFSVAERGSCAKVGGWPGYVFMTYLIRYICFFSAEKCSNVRLRVHSMEIRIFWVSILVK